jgi:dihydropteroate synthase
MHAPTTPRLLRCGRFSLQLSRPLIMGVVNVTPDSFSDGGAYFHPGAAIARARALIVQGADIVDIGAESTRPGAAPVSVGDELARVLPVLSGLQDAPVPVSIDTWKPEVMVAVLERGAGMINDVNALAAPGAIDAVRGSDCAICLMHKKGDPRTMQTAPVYADVVAEVRDFLGERVVAAETAGIARQRLVVDPGFGFGKTAVHNLQLLRQLDSLQALGVPIMAGLSRKSLLGRITGRRVDERVAASVAAALLAVERGAALVRVHDVAATRDALQVLSAVKDPDYRFNDEWAQ